MGEEKYKVGRKYYAVIRLHCNVIDLSHRQLPARIYLVQPMILSLIFVYGKEVFCYVFPPTALYCCFSLLLSSYKD